VSLVREEKLELLDTEFDNFLGERLYDLVRPKLVVSLCGAPALNEDASLVPFLSVFNGRAI